MCILNRVGRTGVTDKVAFEQRYGEGEELGRDDVPGKNLPWGRDSKCRCCAGSLQEQHGAGMAAPSRGRTEGGKSGKQQGARLCGALLAFPLREMRIILQGTEQKAMR